MALSFTEKRNLQKVISTNLSALAGSSVSFTEKRRLQKDITDAFAKLKQAVELPGSEQNQKLADLIAGKFNSEQPEAFLVILKDIIAEINDVQPVIPPTVTYIETNQDKISAVMESALAETFGGLWGKVTDNEQLILEAASRRGARGSFPFAPPSPIPSSSPIIVTALPDAAGFTGQKISIEIDGEFGEPATFRDRIQAIETAKGGDLVEIRINSNGGNTMSAQAFYAALLKTQARTKAVIINAYSSGSVVGMSCDEIELTPFCSMMIHNASSGVGGKIGDMAGYATFKQGYFAEWFGQLYAGFLTPDELQDVAKGQDIWLKEDQIRERLNNWKPIRGRLEPAAAA